MSEPLDWLEDVRAAGGDEEPLVLFSTTEAAVRPSASLGGDARDLDDFWPLADHLSERAARPGPVVVFTDADEDPAARATAISKLARLLSESELRVLVVDADLQREGLAVLLGDGEAEGLVDLLLYGASPAATCRPSGLRGVDVLGIGSFRPDTPEPFEDEVLQRGLAQLSGAYDLVLISAPALVPGDRYNPLLVHADGLVLTPRREADDPARSRALLEYLEGQMLPVWAAMAFSSAVVPTAASVEAAGPIEDPAAPATVVHRLETEEPSSPLFQRLAIGLAVLLLGFVGWWAVTQMATEDPPPPTPPLVAKAAETARQQARTPTPAPGDPATDPSLRDATETEPETATDEDPVGEVDPEVDPLPESPTQVPATPEVDPVVDSTGDPGAEDVDQEADPDPPGAETADPAGTDPIPAAARLRPGDGWALHLWSFPDTTEALTAMRVLVRDGFEPAVVGADIDGRRWFRVVVGRFARRSAAMEARTILGARPDVEYVGVVRVP